MSDLRVLPWSILLPFSCLNFSSLLVEKLKCYAKNDKRKCTCLHVYKSTDPAVTIEY